MAATSVLLADDDVRLRQFLELELREEGYAVRSCGDGIGALTQIRQEPPDLLVLDWMLPDLSGVEVCQRLRSTGVQVPVLMLTGRDAVKDRVEALVQPAKTDPIPIRYRPQPSRFLLRVADQCQC